MPLHLVIGLDETWDTKVSHGYVCFTRPGAGYEDFFCSIKLCFCQSGIQPKFTVVFWGTGRGIVDFDKQAYEDDVLLFLKIRIGQTEESSLSGKTHIRTR